MNPWGQKVSTGIGVAALISAAIFSLVVVFHFINKTEALALSISSANSLIYNENNLSACSQEVKICPDGSSIGRMGPNCEFKPCPKNNSQIANPASVYCEKNGGKLEMRTESGSGQVGYCKFSDGSECEEWRYFRQECAPGKNNL